MNVLVLPWVELAVLIPLLGGLGVYFVRDVPSAWRLALGCTSAAFLCSILAWVAFSVGVQSAYWLIPWWPALQLDQLSAPLLSIVALLHVLTVGTTARVKMNRMSFSGHLIGAAIRLAIFACLDPWPLILLLSLGTVPPLVEMLRRGKPTRLYLIHMALFLVLLVSGCKPRPSSACTPRCVWCCRSRRRGCFPASWWFPC
jgi:NADH-quinone oxidoreductase subunit M